MISCITCSHEFSMGETERTIKFPCCSNYLCDECSQAWIEVARSQMWVVNSECPSCAEPVPTETYIGLLEESEKEQLIFAQFTISEPLNSNEKWLTCPHCAYKEIGEWDDMLILCKNENCEKLTCLICNRSIEYKKDQIVPVKSLTSNQTALQSMLENHIIDEMKEHESCIEYSDMIMQIQIAMENSLTRKCPSCNYRARKDKYCTHISCESCGAYWCYVCGSTYIDEGHNICEDDFKDGCPMYLERVSDLRSSWPDDSLEALDKFHCHFTLNQLHDLFLVYGEDEFEFVNNNFPHVFEGFDLKDIFDFQYIFREG